MKPNEPLAWDPADIAKRINNGAVVKLGKWLTVWRQGNVVVQQCNRCHYEQRLTKREVAMLRTEEFADFLTRHAHEEMPS